MNRKMNIDEKVAQIYKEYDNLSKKQRFGFFSQPVSNNVMDSYQQKSTKNNTRSKYQNQRSKTSQQKKAFVVSTKIQNGFQQPVFNTINDTYIDPFRLRKYNYQNNRFKERKTYQPFKSTNPQTNVFSSYQYDLNFLQQKGSKTYTQGFGFQKSQAQEQQFANSRQSQKKYHKRNFSVQTKKNGLFSTYKYQSNSQQQEKGQPKKTFLHGNFKTGKSNYPQQNKYLDNLKFTLKKQTVLNGFQNKENKQENLRPWKMSKKLQTGPYGGFSNYPQYISNQRREQLRKKQDKIWVPNSLQANTRPTPSVMQRT